MNQPKSDCPKCYWVNTWTDSGDRGAAAADHEFDAHPDHEHDFSVIYDGDFPGFLAGYMTNVTTGGMVSKRVRSVYFCSECGTRDDSPGQWIVWNTKDSGLNPPD